MNRFYYFFLLFISLISYGQGDSSTITRDPIIERHFDPNFKAKYKDTAFIYEFKIPEKNAWDRFKEWLYNLLKDIFGFTNKSKALDNIGVVIKVLAALLIIFVIYLIVKAILNKEGGWIFSRKTTSIVDYTDIEKNIHNVDFKKLIADAEARNDNRLAIRYYYLWLLKKMAAKNIIDWNPEKTNSDYSYEITNQNLKENFTYLSYLYNYAWYGEFEITPEIFSKTKNAFQKAIATI